MVVCPWSSVGGIGLKLSLCTIPENGIEGVKGRFLLRRPKAYTANSTAIPAIPHPMPTPILALVLRPDDAVALEIGSAVMAGTLD